MIEVEQTCEVTPEVLERLRRLLQDRLPDIVVNDDVYYDTPDGYLYKQAVFVRVRTNGRKSALQFKFDEPESDRLHMICTERAFALLDEQPLPDGVHELFAHFLPDWQPASTWSQAIACNRLTELIRIDNTRQLYYLEPEQVTLCLDQVRDLGLFLEIEVLCEEGTDPEVARTRVEGMVQLLGGKPLTAGYVEMALQRFKPEIYAYGQYHL